MILFAKIYQFEVLYLISGGSLVSFHVPLSKVLDDRGNLASMWVFG